LTIANDSATGNGNLTLANGTIQVEGSSRSLNNSGSSFASDLTISGSDLIFTGPATLTGNRTLTLNNVNTTFLSGIGQDLSSRKLTKTGAGTLSLAGNSSFSGGLVIKAGAVVQNGNLLADLTNKTTFTYNSGTFGGVLINQGTFITNADFTAGGGIENDTTMTVPSVRTLTANGAGLMNVG